MSTVEQRLRDLGDHLDEHHPAITADELSARSVPAGPAPRTVHRRLVLAAAAAIVIVVVAAVALLDHGEEGTSRVITDPDPPVDPEPPDVPPTFTGEDSGVGAVALDWTPVEGLEVSPVASHTTVLSDGSAFFAGAPSGALLTSPDGADWQLLTSTTFAFRRGGAVAGAAQLAAVHDGTALVVERSESDEIVVSLIGADGEVATSRLPAVGTADVDAAMGPNGMVLTTDLDVFRSADGLTWERVEGSLLPRSFDEESSELAATGSGFVGLTGGEGDPLFSTDGQVWAPVAVSDGNGLARFRTVHSFRGGATLDGTAYVSADGSSTAYLPPPDIGGGLILDPTGPGGQAGVGALVRTPVPFPEARDVAIGDGITWTRLGLPAGLAGFPPLAIAADREAVVIVTEEGRAWRASLAGVPVAGGGFPSTDAAGQRVDDAAEVGRAFIELRDGRDAAATEALFAPGATVRDGTTDPITDPGGYGGLYEFFAAVDWRFVPEGCAGAESPTGTVHLSCRFRDDNAWSRVITGTDLDPLARAGEGHVGIEIENGLIVDLSHSPASVGPSADGFMAFRVFVEDTHPDDVATMYESMIWPRFEPESIELWSLYTAEFVERGLVEELTTGAYRERFLAAFAAQAGGDPPTEEYP